MKILSTNVKNCLKAQNCGKNRPDWAKRLFIWESGEISQAQKFMCPGVITTTTTTWDEQQQKHEQQQQQSNNNNKTK